MLMLQVCFTWGLIVRLPGSRPAEKAKQFRGTAVFAEATPLPVNDIDAYNKAGAHFESMRRAIRRLQTSVTVRGSDVNLNHIFGPV